MRILVVFILLLTFCLQKFPDNGYGDGCGYGSGYGNGSGNIIPTPTPTSDSEIRFHESSIRKADSLYKNYLPQSNFEEVKAAVEFFDSLRLTMDNGDGDGCGYGNGDGNGNGNIIPTPTSDSASASDPAIRLQTPILLCAKAHYYHAVGPTEKYDIVGACEHYLIALEIMEDMMAKDKSLRKKDKRLKAKRKKIVDNPEDYEKIRFVSLIYTRLGELFYNESYCYISIIMYKNALNYVEILNNNESKSQIYKLLGNSYQLFNISDSALYYYNKSLETNTILSNKLDVEKSIALILYNEGKRDSAYHIIKNNLNKTSNENVKYSYHCLLGNFYYNDKAYDSALYYLETSLDNHIITQKIAFTTMLSAIYNSLGNYEKRAYYDNISSKLFINNTNKEIDKSQLQTLYNDYNKRKIEKEKSIDRKKKRNKTIIISIITIVVVIYVIVYIRHKYRKQNDKLNKKIDGYANENKQLIEVFQKTNSKKDRIIKQQKKEISEIKNQLNRKSDIDIEAYYNSEICKNISGRKESELTPLTNKELALLLEAADKNLGNISSRLCEQIPSLNKNDIYTICLIILNIEKNKFPYLLGRDRKTIYDRLNKIKTQMNLGPKQDLFIHIRDTYIN